MSAQRRAIAIVRVSQVNGRDGERFVSPEDQRQQAEALCKREGLKLLDSWPELDVSGGAPLRRRQHLRRAVEAIEAGKAEVLIAAYFDRLVRSLKVQAEVVERVEAANGEVRLGDFGQLTEGTAVQWFSGTLVGAAAEYLRRSTAERLAKVQQIAIEQGRWPVILIPSLRRDESGQIELDPANLAIVEGACRLRLSGATFAEVRDYLKRHGIERSYHGTTSLLKSRQLIGEITFGHRVGTVPATIDRDTFDRMQRRSVPRGRKPKSDRLLARLGVLRCGSCGSRMVVATSHNSSYWTYRCPPTGDCSHRMSISAELVEGAIVAWAKHHLARLTGTASGASGVTEARAELERTQAAYDKALMVAMEAASEPVVMETVRERREARDRAKERYGEATETQEWLNVAVTVGDWDDLSPEGRRDLIKAAIARVLIHPGRGVERIELEPR
jgi:DNA invertase Pin-like site-specific DNA recombinase